MAIKILTKNSIDNTNIDGARQNHFSAGMKSGIVKGSFNEGRFFASATNIIALDACELRISGHRVVIDSVQYFTLSNRPSNSTKYSMIAEISVNDNSEPTFRLFIQQSNIQLIKNNLFNTNIGSGTYQLEIGTFILSSSGNISDVLKTTKMITGGSDVINVGTITTTTLEPNQKANVNVSSGTDDEENHVLNFKFEIPKGVKGDKGDRGEQGVKGDNGVASGVVLSNTYDNSDENGYTKRAVNNLVSNPNLLINGDFRVNQRGQKLYERTSGRVYTVDRWGIWSNNCTFNAETKTLTNLVTSGNAIMSQFIEDSEALFGKTLTLSANINDTIHTVTGTIANSYDNFTSDTVIFIKEIKDMGVLVSYIRAMWDVSRQKIRIDIGCTPTGKNITIKYAKLEVGSVATAFSPRPYTDELAMCQRYYQRIRVNGSMGFVANVNVLYSGVPLIQTMRATPSVTNEVQTSVREIGKGIKGNVDLVFNYLYDNILQISADTSSLGLTEYSGCVLVNGTLVLESEF